MVIKVQEGTTYKRITETEEPRKYHAFKLSIDLAVPVSDDETESILAEDIYSYLNTLIAGGVYNFDILSNVETEDMDHAYTDDAWFNY